MSFKYLTGQTTAGAADEIVDWFATFQNWMEQIGWIVAAGGGTTNVVFRSLGEDGGLTMLFLHVYRDGGFPNRVRINVMNDAVGTQETDEGGYVDGGGAQFTFWMAGDMDAVNICFLGGGAYNTVYAGMVMPFALTVPDETYRMIATSLQTAGSILRDSDDVWDVDHGLYSHATLEATIVDPYDGSFPLCAKFFDRFANIAGQLKHVSGPVAPVALAVQTELTTGRGSRITPWIVLADRAANRYAMRTGGVVPTGTPDPTSFTATTGMAANYADLWNRVSAHLTGIGWADLGDPGILDSGRLFFSAGQSGEDEIFVGFYQDIEVTDFISAYVQNDAAATQRTTTEVTHLDTLDFPVRYWLSADLDCAALVFQRAPGYGFVWAGLYRQFTPGLLPPYVGAPLTPYSLLSESNGPPFGQRVMVLRSKTGVWENAGVYSHEGANIAGSSPNDFDGETYLIWPLTASDAGGATSGQLTYLGFASGGGLGNQDTIRIGDQIYTSFYTSAGINFCLRTE